MRKKWPVLHGGRHGAGPTWRPSPVLRGDVGRSYMEAFTGSTWRPVLLTGPTWRPCLLAVLRGGLGRSYVASLWRPWPVPREGLHRSYVEALAGGLGRPYMEAEALAGPMWRRSPGPAWRHWPVLRPSPTWRPWPDKRGSAQGPMSRGPTWSFTAGPTWRPCRPIGQSHVQAVTGPTTWRGTTWPSPVLRGGLHQSYVEAFTGGLGRSRMAPRGGRSNVEPYVEALAYVEALSVGGGLGHVGLVKAST